MAEPQSDFADFLKKMPVKISGYLQTGWNYTSNKNASTSSFQAKRLRLLLDGKVSENVDFRLQIEAFNGIAGSTNGNGQKNIQVMDAFATWKICPEFKVRAGQFYTPLGYENYDISPATLETVDFSNIVYRIACRNPYSYNLVDYGRDLGVMLIGDLGKYFHYDFAVTNGSIPCKDDNNNTKDIYASVTIKPFKNFNVKATYNWGEYNPQALAGGTAPGMGVSKYMPMNRFVVGAWYFRLELAAQTATTEHRHFVGFALLVDKHVRFSLHALPVPAQHVAAVVGHVAGLQHHDRQSDKALADLQHFHFW